jgi:hypothetical protein
MGAGSSPVHAADGARPAFRSSLLPVIAGPDCALKSTQ